MNLLRKFDKKKLRFKKFSYVTDFKDGYALAIPKLVDKIQGFNQISVINKKQEVVQETSFSYFFDNSDDTVKWMNGYIKACDDSCKHNNNYVFLDKNLQKVEGHQYAYISFNMYKDPYILVIEFRDGITYKGILDKDLNVVLSTSYYNIHYLDNHKFAARKNINDKNTQIYDVKEKKHKEIKGHIEEIVFYQNIPYYKFCFDSKHGYYDQDFETYIQANYQKLGFINPKGKIPFERMGRSGVIDIKIKKEIYR